METWGKESITSIQGGNAMKKMIVLLLAICFLTLGPNIAAFAEWDPAQVELERVMAEETMAQFKVNAPRTARFFDNAYGYAVFPTIGKGAFIIGAATGSGLVYEQGEIVGRVTLSQGTVGLQAGGQTYSQIIFFHDEVALGNLKDNKMKFSGQASAIAATTAASTAVDYEGGVAVFTMGKAGLMLEASIGGQDFEFQPKP
jgi:lipid-binding SYLF domain-containing protein